MNPDQEHEKYYGENPQGNHFLPSSETKEFMQRQLDINEKVEKRLDSIDQTLVRIEGKVDSTFAQATKTNGRVNRLETWRNMIVGGMTVVVMGAPAIAWLVEFYFNHR